MRKLRCVHRYGHETTLLRGALKKNYQTTKIAEKTKASMLAARDRQIRRRRRRRRRRDLRARFRGPVDP